MTRFTPALLAVCLPLPAQAEALRCVPDFPVYCANLHVSCAGRSDLPTPELHIVTARHMAWVRENGDTRIKGVTHDRNARILRGAGAGYIRIDADGRYSQRIYVNGRAWMSIGNCYSTSGASQ